MKGEFKLYKFVMQERIEIRDDGEYISAWIPYNCMQEFRNSLSSCYFDDGGVECVMMYDCVWINFSDLLDYHGYDRDVYLED